MKLNCIHCRGEFAITTDQLGNTGLCPHCHHEVRFPSAESNAPDTAPPPASHFWENSIAGLTSMVFHMALFLVLALVRWTSDGGPGLGEEVLIGGLPSVSLSAAQNEQLGTELPSATQSEVPESLEIHAPVQPSPSAVSDPLQSLAIVSPSTGGGSTSSLDLGAVSIGGATAGGGGWGSLVQSLRRNGLDIVIVFDSTGSMGGEIRAVEGQIQRIGTALLKLAPKARISVCTYRDEGDEYEVKGLPLTGDIIAINRFLQTTRADAGGDEPEAVHKGLQWAVEQNTFRPQARKVILLFGDAPPHSQYLDTCLRIAADFQQKQKGIVSTVTCRRSTPLPAFAQIAKAGGGEAFLTHNEREIMTQLMVLVFGSAHREKVVEAFKLLER